MAPATLSEFVAGLAIEEFSQRAHILLVAYFMRVSGRTDFNAAALQKEFQDGGLPPPDHLTTRLWQLATSKQAALIRLAPGRYSLSIHGVREVEQYVKAQPSTAAGSQPFEVLVGRLAASSQRRFLSEAVSCIQHGAKRAAIVMTWELTCDHLYQFVLKHKLADFNAALAKRSDAKKSLRITTADDFGDLKETVFIEVLRSAQIISNDVRKILDEKLGTRNSAGHPSNIEFHDSKVTNFVEDLVDNVILKYPL